MARRTAALLAAFLVLAAATAAAESSRSKRPNRAAAAPVVETSETSSVAAAPTSTPATSTPASTSAPAPTAGSSSPASFATASSTLLLGSLVLVALLYAASRLVRRMPIARFLPSAEGPIRIASRTHLGARESLCLVDVGTTTLLLAVTGQSIQTLHVWPDGVRPTVAGPGVSTPSVPGQLRELAARLTGSR